MKIGLIDVDGHNFPNLALMKISAWHRRHGDEVEWWRAQESWYDIVYMSKVFTAAYSPDKPTPWNAGKVIKGGTGYAIKIEKGKEVYHKELDPPLDPEIESIYPDYSIYPELTKDTAYGFLTRGCPRACDFCHVAPKEGRCSVKVADLSQFWDGQKHIKLLDPNILACKDAPDLLQQLVDSKARVDFTQGLDARLITTELADFLAQMRMDNLHFAMDRMDQMAPVERGIRRFVDAYKAKGGKWNERRANVFMLTNFDTTHAQDMERIAAIQRCECRPYVMVYNKPTAPPVTRRLQQWCNSIVAYLKYKDDFEGFQRAKFKTVYLTD